jgi:hypothetical protein
MACAESAIPAFATTRSSMLGHGFLVVMTNVKTLSPTELSPAAIVYPISPPASAVVQKAITP